MRRRLVVILLVVLWTTGFVATTPSAAICVGPEITVTPSSGAAGTAITVSGKYFGTDCIDTGPDPSLGAPDTGLVVTFVDAAGTSTELGTVDADADYRFTLTTTVPSAAAVGAGSVRSTTSLDTDPAALFVVVDGVIPATPVFTG